MKWAFLTLIKIYWKILPENKRRSCLFRESCSRYVHRHIVEHGFFSGCKAFKLRVQQCRKGYQLYSGAHGFEIKLADGSIIEEEEISPNLLSPIYRQVRKDSDPNIGANSTP